MVSKGKGIIGAIGTVTGRLADLFFHTPTTYGVDIEVIDPIGETARQLPTDYFKTLEDNDQVAKTGMTKKEFIKTLPKWARPAFKNNVYVGFIGPLHQEQIIRLQSEHLRASKPKEPNYSMAEIDFIIDSMGYEAPDAPEELGPNFKLWVEKNKEKLAKIKEWDDILKTYGFEPTVQYGLGAPVQKRTFEQYRRECKA